MSIVAHFCNFFDDMECANSTLHLCILLSINTVLYTQNTEYLGQAYFFLRSSMCAKTFKQYLSIKLRRRPARRLPRQNHATLLRIDRSKGVVSGCKQSSAGFKGNILVPEQCSCHRPTGATQVAVSFCRPVLCDR